MTNRNLCAIVIGCGLLIASTGAEGAGRGPSTPEERKQALKYISDFEADPLNQELQPEIQWVVKWTMEVPDVRLNICQGLF